MAISPPGDLILDVVRAADPAKVREAHANLIEKGKAVAETVFDLAAGRPIGAEIKPNDAEAIPDSYREFEALVLQTFLQSMWPKESESTFGEGTAGDMWKGLMSEHLGRVMAEGGGIGIARQLAQQNDPAASVGERTNLASRLVDEIEMNMLRDSTAGAGGSQRDGNGSPV